jgi:hypothetical protein
MDKKPPDLLKPEDASQFGRFYPAYGSLQPLLILGQPGVADSGLSPMDDQFVFRMSRLSEKGLELLARQGIPVRIAQR